MQVLEGYVYLGEITALGDEVLTAFTSAISSAATRVVRGVVVSRAGLEERARATAIFGELVKLLPADLFRPCLAQVSSDCLPRCSGCRHNSPMQAMPAAAVATQSSSMHLVWPC